MATADEILAQQAEEYKNAPRSLRWQPPDGTYMEVITEVSSQFITRGGQKVPAVTIVGEIVDGEWQGKRNSLGVFASPHWGFLADVVEALGGDEQGNPAAAKDFLASKIGTLVSVQVRRTKNKVTKVEYANANILGEVPQESA